MAFEHLQTEHLNLLKQALTGIHLANYGEFKPKYSGGDTFRLKPLYLLDRFLKKRGYSICQEVPFDHKPWANGKVHAHKMDTMVGLARLDNFQWCIESVLRNKVPGAIVETGVWRGGASILAEAVLHLHQATDRILALFDTFDGLPPADPRYAADAGDLLHTIGYLKASIELVRYNFSKYGLLYDNVQFFKGLAEETMPIAPIEQVAVLRIDLDMYRGVYGALQAMYHKVTPGGFIIIDDWGSMPACRKAVEDFWKENNIQPSYNIIDNDGIFWQKL